MAVTIRGLSKLIKTLTIVCDVIGAFGPKIRDYVPPAQQAAYDQALQDITTACSVIRTIDYLYDGIGTNQ